MPQRIRVLWLSRHALLEEQLVALKAYPCWSGNEIDVVNVNFTFAAQSHAAVDQLIELIDEHGADMVAGVFPAHIAVRYLKQREQTRYRSNGKYLPELALPVSVPAPAKEGELRGNGFTFSHWEFVS
jgi:hypothetical protein